MYWKGITRCTINQCALGQRGYLQNVLESYCWMYYKLVYSRLEWVFAESTGKLLLDVLKTSVLQARGGICRMYWKATAGCTKTSVLQARVGICRIYWKATAGCTINQCTLVLEGVFGESTGKLLLDVLKTSVLQARGGIEPNVLKNYYKMYYIQVYSRLEGVLSRMYLKAIAGCTRPSIYHVSTKERALLGIR